MNVFNSIPLNRLVPPGNMLLSGFAEFFLEIRAGERFQFYGCAAPRIAARPRVSPLAYVDRRRRVGRPCRERERAREREREREDVFFACVSD